MRNYSKGKVSSRQSHGDRSSRVSSPGMKIVSPLRKMCDVGSTDR